MFELVLLVDRDAKYTMKDKKQHFLRKHVCEVALVGRLWRQLHYEG